MQASRECVCCKEIVKVVEKMNDLVNPITEHPGYEAVSLNE